MNSRIKKESADKVVVDQGLVESRQKAQAMIMAGLVYSDGQKIEKAGQRICVDQEIFLKERLPFVSRGGLKLNEALEKFEISVDGQVAADLGASTGGFTDCLLQRGAEKVYAVDVDTKQIDWHLRKNPRITLIEKNARYLEKGDFPDSLDLVTMDLSFISVLKVFPAVKGFLGKGKMVSLIKPQFEVGRNQVGEKGIVRDPALHEDVLNRIIKEAKKMGFGVKGLMNPSIHGQKGNREFFIFWTLGTEYFNEIQVKALIKEAVQNEKN